MIFGRGGEEAAELAAAGVTFEIVPGISSTIGGPAYAGIPVTHRDHNTQLTIFTGHEDPTKGFTSVDYEQLAKHLAPRSSSWASRDCVKFATPSSNTAPIRTLRSP